MTIQHINAETGEILTPQQVARLMSRPKRWDRPDRPRRSEYELQRRRISRVAKALRQDVVLALVGAVTIIGFMLVR